MVTFAVLLLVFATAQCFAFAFTRECSRGRFTIRSSRTMTLAKKDNDSNDSGTDDEDWRDFRAKLVMKFREDESKDEGDGDGTITPKQKSDNLPSLNGGWAYESGDAIEKGSVIISCPEQDFGYGLRQQYFHKCIVLVIYHEEKSFTKGIVLNRPTDLVLSDDDFVHTDGTPLQDTKPGRNWKIWFGGEVRGIDSDDPEQICLHSLTSEAANAVSERVLKNIQWTTMSGARKLVNDGDATPEDFVIYCGYAGWNAGQLVNELERKSWYMLQTDDKTLLDEIQKTDDANPERAGLDTWKMLMDMIGKGEESRKSEGGFDDLMLKEWAKQRLIYNDDSAAVRSVEEETAAIVARAERIASFSPGTIIRSSADTGNGQPFLLEDQEFLQSVILVIQDDEYITVGVILNLPSAYNIDIEMGRESSGQKKTKQVVSIPQHYGGKYGLKGQTEKPSVWLHCSEELKEAKVGSRLGKGKDDTNIWICTQDDAEIALGIPGLAEADDFMVINGFTVWEKSREEGVIGGLEAEMLAGNFEVVSKDKTEELWDELISQQELLTSENIVATLDAAQAAWICAGGTNSSSTDLVMNDEGPGNSENGTPNLAYMARKSWWSTFLLGDPKLRFL